MTFELIRDILGWCSLINIGLVACWGLMILLIPGFIFNLHSKVFVEMQRPEFDRIHYTGIVYYKVLIFVFNLVPYLAMRIVG